MSAFAFMSLMSVLAVWAGASMICNWFINNQVASDGMVIHPLYRCTILFFAPLLIVVIVAFGIVTYTMTQH